MAKDKMGNEKELELIEFIENGNMRTTKEVGHRKVGKLVEKSGERQIEMKTNLKMVKM